MIKNFLKITIRNLWRYKIFSAINIFGLAIGLACSILILLWVQNELSYDRFHKNASNIYRVIMNNATELPYPMAATLKEEIPEIVNAARIEYAPRMTMQVDDKKFYEDKVAMVDPEFFEILDFAFVKGDPKTAFQKPFNVVISESQAHKYFGNADPMGQTIMVDNTFPATVQGVMQDVPENSHLQFDMLISINILTQIGNDIVSWQNWGPSIYVQTPSHIDREATALKISDVFTAHHADNKQIMELQPLSNIHVRPGIKYDKAVITDLKSIMILSMIAIFILAIVCINAINITTARYSERTVEVGIRKTSGANRTQLFWQFLSESFILTAIACVFAIIFLELLLPLFEQIAGKALLLHSFSWKTLWVISGVVILTGIVSSIYPAIYLSSFSAARVLKLKGQVQSGKATLRKSMLIIQFALSVIFIVGTLVISQQLQYIQHKDLGFDKENILYVPMKGTFLKQFDMVKSRLKENANIVQVSAKNCSPLVRRQTFGGLYWPGKDPEHKIWAEVNSVDVDYFDLMGLKLAKGRTFSKEFLTDKENAILLNETTVRQIGMDSIVGKQITFREPKTVIGVIKDANFASLHRPVDTQLYRLIDFSDPDLHWEGIVLIKLREFQKANGLSSTQTTLSFIESLWNETNSNIPFEYHFLNAQIDRFYHNDIRLYRLYKYFAILAILLSSLGLYGLSAFSIIKRAKEIGIRKILGSSTPGIMILLTKGYLKLILIANVIAWPLAWFVMNKWLQSFAYRISINWWVFAVAGAGVTLIALGTISWQAVRAATGNQIDALRNE